MTNIEYFANKVKADQGAAQEGTATDAKFQPASLVRDGHGIPVDLERGVRMELLASSNQDDYWVIKATLQPGENVPLHSHNEPESFYVLSGQAEALVQIDHGLEWQTVRTGDFIHIPANLKHAWRNRSSAPSAQIVVTTTRLGKFFQELGEILRIGDHKGTMEKLRHLSERFGFWVGSLEENAAVGISLA